MVKEIDRALTAHELIKVKILADRDAREEIADAMCAQTACRDRSAGRQSRRIVAAQTRRPAPSCIAQLSRQWRRFDAFAERERRAHRGHDRCRAGQPGDLTQPEYRFDAGAVRA